MSIVPIPSAVTSFRDALGIALELSEEFAYTQAVVVIDDAGRCIDFNLFGRIGQGLMTMLSWISSRSSAYPPGSGVVLISVRSVDGPIIWEQDIADYRFARQALQRVGVSVVDWIETDGELVRSYAYIVNPNTSWSIDAASEGAADCSDW